MNPRYILFDFDGVIVDSFAPAFEVKKMICPPLTENHFRKIFEGNINDEFNLEFKHDERCHHDIDFSATYLPIMRERVKVVSGIEDIIKELAKSYTMIVISSTISAPIGELLEKYGLAKYFKEIMGNDVHKSKVEKIKMVFEKYQTDAEHCVFITDTLGDMREAAVMNVGAIAVTWGFHARETLEKGNPFRIVERKEDLATAVGEYFNN